MSHSGDATSVFGFTGEQWDAATGLTYLRARYYSSAQGRFTTRDVWEGNYEEPLSLNRWNYTNGNPINRTDPSGHDGGVLTFGQLLETCLRNPAACAGAGISAFSVSPEVTVVVVGGTAIVVAMPSMEVIACWAIQDIGPNYPMPATFQPGAVQSTYPLAQSGTLTIGATSVVYAKTGSEIFAHIGMLMGGATVGGIPPHSGKPDPDGRDRKHNVEGLRNTLRDELDKMQKAWGKSRQPDLAEWLAENGWKQEDILDAIRFLQNYARYVLPNDVANYGVSEQLESEILSLLRLMGVMP